MTEQRKHQLLLEVATLGLAVSDLAWDGRLALVRGDAPEVEYAASKAVIKATRALRIMQAIQADMDPIDL